jgi:hypothetical protein
VATEAAWLNGNNLEKEETKQKKEKKREKWEKTLTLTGLLMEGLDRLICDFQDYFRFADKPPGEPCGLFPVLSMDESIW